MRLPAPLASITLVLLSQVIRKRGPRLVYVIERLVELFIRLKEAPEDLLVYCRGISEPAYPVE
jgi:hypothetical protein